MNSFECEFTRGNTFINLKDQTAVSGTNTFVKSNSSALRTLKSVHLEDLGLHVEQHGEKPRVLKVAECSPLDMAGIQAGDRIISVDMKPVSNPEQLRKLLLRRTVRGDAEFCVERAGRILFIQVQFHD